MKKFPSFELEDEALGKQWTDALSTCLSTLMNIIIMSKEKEMNALQQEISDLQQATRPPLIHRREHIPQVHQKMACKNENTGRAGKGT